MTIKEFDQWKEDYGLEYEPNYSSDTEIDCLHAFKAGQRSKQEEIDRLNCLLADLHKVCINIKEGYIRENYQEYDKGWRDCAVAVRTQIESKWKLIK